MKTKINSENSQRKLIFIRHSKAEEHTAGIPDFERSLTARGKVNSRLMAEILKSKGEEPGKIISSPAFRALETALIFSREYGISEAEIKLAPELYLDLSEEEFLPYIRKQNNKDHTITFFGHNPLITEMAAYFAADEPESLAKTGIYCLVFDAASWAEIEPESGRTLYYLTPADLS
ncbi:MAG: SixA phosphatase family protein [Actinomycetota bacterium]|jgi:phosphohistidine phosphatase